MTNFNNKKLNLFKKFKKNWYKWVYRNSDYELNSFQFIPPEQIIKLKKTNKVSIPKFVEDYIKTFDTFKDVYSFIVSATDFSDELEEWLGYTDSHKYGNKENELKLLSALINGYTIEDKTNKEQIMKVTINEEFYIEIDDMNHTLKRVTGRVDKDGNPSDKVIGYYRDVSDCLIKTARIMASESQPEATISEYLEIFDNCIKRLEDACKGL